MATQTSGGGENSSYLSNKDAISSVLLTLPITCQICLGKVKDPVICPNQHVFCSTCMAQWLSSNQICPTCRVPINETQPCKRIIGSLDCSHPSPDRDVKEQLRKTRFELLFQEYEGEIGSLENQLDKTLIENKRLSKSVVELTKKLEESEERFLRAVNTSSTKEKANGDTVSTDINTILKLSSKLQDLIQFNHRLKDENSGLKEEIKRLEAENSKMADEMKKLVEETSFARSPQKYGKYTVAALQTKVDNYEKEIQRLKRALDRSDEYIDQLNGELCDLRGVDSDSVPMRVTERAPRENGGIDSNGYLSKANTASSGTAAFAVRRQINLSMGKSSLNHASTGAFMPSSSAFTAVDKDKRTSLNCNGDAPKASVSRAEVSSETSGMDTGKGLAASTDLFVGSAVSLNTADASPQGTLDNKFQESGTSDTFADPLRFPACAKLIQLTKAHRMLSHPLNTKLRANGDTVPVNAANTSGDDSPATSMMPAVTSASVVVSPRNNLVDLLLQPRESARKERRTTDSPNREGQASVSKTYLSPSQAQNGDNDTTRSPGNTTQTPSPPALIPTLGEQCTAYDSVSASPHVNRSPPPLSYCGGLSTSSQTKYSAAAYVSTATVKNSPGETCKESVGQHDEPSAFPISPKRIKLEPQD